MGALRELLAVFQIKVEGEALDKATKKVDGFVGKLKAAAPVILEALGGEAVKEFFSRQIENAAHVQDLADRLDVSAMSIQGFGFAAKSAGIDLDTAAHALGVLQRNIGMATQGQKEQAVAFAKLGVSLKDGAGHAKPFEAVLGDVAEAMKKLPDQSTRAAFAMETLGRSGTELLPILSKGRDALEELFKEQRELSNGLGNDFYADAKKAREEFEHFSYAVQSLKDRALAAALPLLDRLALWLKDTTKSVLEFTKHTNVLASGMAFLGAVAAWKLIGALRTMVQTLGILEAEVLLPIAALALLYVAFDDIFTMLKGGKSISGDIIDSLFGEGAAAKIAGTSDSIELLKFGGEAAAIALITAFSPVLGVFAALALAATEAADAIEKAKYAGETEEQHKARMERESPENRALWDKAQAAQKARVQKDQADYGSGKKSGSVKIGPITSGYEGEGGVGANGVGYNADLARKSGLSDAEKAYNIIHSREMHTPVAFTPYSSAAATPKKGAAGGAGPSHVQQVNHVKVEVKTGSGDPQKIGDEVSKGVSRGMRKDASNTLASLVVP